VIDHPFVLRNAVARAVKRKPRAQPASLAVGAVLLLVSLCIVPLISQNLPGTEAATASGDPVIAAAGDIACDPLDPNFNAGLGKPGACRQQATSDLLVSLAPAAVLSLGDVQYECGGYAAFLQVYDPTWGRLKSITHPVVGNHEYLTSTVTGTDCTPSNAGAAGYFRYFGSAAGAPGNGYYSFDLGSWHLIALNSNCADAGGCVPGTPQGDWLAADLAAHHNVCTLAYWHIPLFSSGRFTAQNSKTFWQALYNANADLILNGHDHIYERFAPQTPAGMLDTARGIRQFTVGTGGENHTAITGTLSANSEVLNDDTFGVLKLTLHATSYAWQFIPASGATFTDSGSASCHTATSPTPAPTGAPSMGKRIYLPLVYR
jgi:hypothetical protein